MGEGFFLETARKHEEYRSRCINLMPSENSASREVLSLLSSDLSNRYTLKLRGDVHGCFVENAYGGTRYTDAIEERAEELARKVYGCGGASVKPLSGHIAGMIMLLSTIKRGGRLLTISAEHGGYDGYMPDYMPDMLGYEVSFLPFDEERGTLDTKASADAVREARPDLVLVGTSFFPFPYELGPIAEACGEVGAKLGYDGSHVLGLIAGGEFQRPFEDGVDILMGSTHKSLFGPQGGMVLTREEKLIEKARENLTWRTLDNAHWNRIAALGQALLELQEFGKEYACQVVRNSKALAKALDEKGIPIRYKEHGYTASHQVLLDLDALEEHHGKSCADFSKLMEDSGIIVDCVARLGTAEVTRMGCKEREMDAIAVLMTRALGGDSVEKDAQELRKGMQMEYCFQ